MSFLTKSKVRLSAVALFVSWHSAQLADGQCLVDQQKVGLYLLAYYKDLGTWDQFAILHVDQQLFLVPFFWW